VHCPRDDVHSGDMRGVAAGRRFIPVAAFRGLLKENPTMKLKSNVKAGLNPQPLPPRAPPRGGE
jgi:hypothetical protein